MTKTTLSLLPPSKGCMHVYKAWLLWSPPPPPSRSLRSENREKETVWTPCKVTLISWMVLMMFAILFERAVNCGQKVNASHPTQLCHWNGENNLFTTWFSVICAFVLFILQMPCAPYTEVVLISIPNLDQGYVVERVSWWVTCTPTPHIQNLSMGLVRSWRGMVS